MNDLATLQASLDALLIAYRTGASEVSYDGKRISYRDGAEMRAAIQSIEDEIASASGVPPMRSVKIRSNKGW